MKKKFFAIILALVAIATTAQAQTYTITLDCGKNGSARLSKTTAAEGEEIVLTQTPHKNYCLKRVYYYIPVEIPWGGTSNLVIFFYNYTAEGAPYNPSTVTFKMPAQDITLFVEWDLIQKPYIPELEVLTVNKGTIEPAFDPSITEYTVLVDYATTEIQVSMDWNWNCFTIIDESQWKAGTLYYHYDMPTYDEHKTGFHAIKELVVGENVIMVNVEHDAGQGGSRLYTLTITRLPDAIVLHDNADNADVIDENAGTTKDVVLHSRTFYRDGRWNTLCLPFNVENFEGTPLEGAEVRTLTGASFENHTLTLNWSAPLSAIEAKMPYIMRWKSSGEPLENIFNPLFPNATICEDSSVELLEFDPPSIQFLGFPYPMDYEADYRYMLYMNNDNHFDYPKEDMIINSFHAHFLFTGEISMGTPDDTSSDNGIIRNIVMSFDDETTEIVNYQLSTVNSNDSWYSIDGRKLQGEPMQKGIYIHNGKKVIK